MLKIIPATDFKTLPWKNGKGETVELAISDKGTVDSFDWRLSMANVVEDGVFSDFSGYERNLVLIEGNGLTLTHNVLHTDRLTQLLDFATFDGGCKTQAEILNGSIKDFNIMTAKGVCQAKVQTFTDTQLHHIHHNELVFAYSLTEQMIVTEANNNSLQIPQGDLLQMNAPKDITISGRSLILIAINSI